MVTVMDGPLAPWSAGMVERLNDLGYALRTAERHIELAKGLNQFLEQRHLCMD